MRQAQDRGQALQATWQAGFAAYAGAHPELAAAWERSLKGTLPTDWQDAIPAFTAGEKLATREASGKVINGLAEKIPHFIGGDADLSVSTLTNIKSSGAFGEGTGRNIHFGVREHAMGAAVNGMAYHGQLHPYGSTFFVFSDYMRPAVRLAALNKLPVTFVWTHDSIGLGEDGPTHQPVEHLMSLRAMPNLVVLRPADAIETADAWRFALQHRRGPTALVLSRQKLPTLDRQAMGSTAQVDRGAYVLVDPDGGLPQAIIIATGSEVHVALEAHQQLAASGLRVRVVSMPSWELFAAQETIYQERVLPTAVTARLAVEAGVTLGWQRWVGSAGAVLGIDHYGASAPAETIFEKLGFTPRHIADCVRKLLV